MTKIYKQSYILYESATLLTAKKISCRPRKKKTASLRQSFVVEIYKLRVDCLIHLINKLAPCVPLFYFEI